MTPRQPVHGTSVAQWTPGVGWRAVLIAGRAGAGKSDLALRLIGRGWTLVSDDYTHVFASGGALYAAAPETIAGRMEVRGVGIVPKRVSGVTRLWMVLEPVEGPVERLPEPAWRDIEGVRLPLLRLSAFEVSTVEKVAAALARL